MEPSQYSILMNKTSSQCKLYFEQGKCDYCNTDFWLRCLALSSVPIGFVFEINFTALAFSKCF